MDLVSILSNIYKKPFVAYTVQDINLFDVEMSDGNLLKILLNIT